VNPRVRLDGFGEKKNYLYRDFEFRTIKPAATDYTAALIENILVNPDKP